MEIEESPILENESNQTLQDKNTHWYSRPFWVIVGIVGGIASLISIPLAFYFYYESKEYPELTFTVHPIKAVLLHKGETSKLSATFEGKPLEGDVTTAQVAIWNNGKKAIKSENILNNQKSIQIQTENNVSILEAKIRKVSRQETQCSINSEQMSKGMIFVSWFILEKNDGCIIQLIYEGNSNVKINAEGAIEGQSNLINVQSNNVSYISLIATIASLPFMLFFVRDSYKNPIKNTKKQKFFLAFFSILLIVQLLTFLSQLLVLYYSQQTLPPFGFDNLM
jgi:uncharacterized membrane protein YesL